VSHVPQGELQGRIDELMVKHGGLRPAARVLQMNAGYLQRLWSGEKDNPSDDVLRKLGLKRTVIIQRRTHEAGGCKS
jgi:hypothetical protein